MKSRQQESRNSRMSAAIATILAGMVATETGPEAPGASAGRVEKLIHRAYPEADYQERDLLIREVWDNARLTFAAALARATGVPQVLEVRYMEHPYIRTWDEYDRAISMGRDFSQRCGRRRITVRPDGSQATTWEYESRGPAPIQACRDALLPVAI